MENNLYIKKYNEANDMHSHDQLDIYDECSFSYLDILKEKEVDTLSKVIVSCKCMNSLNYNMYYDKCDKCNGTGFLLLNGNKVVCNHCRGLGSLVKHSCPLCHGDGKVIKKDRVKVKLNKLLKENDYLTLKGLGKEKYGVKGDLIIKVKISDLNCFEIKGNDIYDRRMIYFSRDDINRNISKRVETIQGFVNVKSSGSNSSEVIKLEKEGIDGGDFYVCLENDLVPLRGKDVYKSIIISRDESSFYFDYDELSNECNFLKISYYKKIHEVKEFVSLNEVNNFKVVKLKGKGMKGKNGGLRGDLYLRIFFDDEFANIDDTLYHYPIKLNKYDILNGKKTLEFDKEKIVLSFEKNLDEMQEVEVKDYGCIVTNKQFKSMKVLVNPFNYDVYRVSVRVNKKDKFIFIKDYEKYFFEEIIKSCDGLKVSLSKNKNLIEIIDDIGNKVLIKIIR